MIRRRAFTSIFSAPAAATDEQAEARRLFPFIASMGRAKFSFVAVTALLVFCAVWLSFGKVHRVWHQAEGTAPDACALCLIANSGFLFATAQPVVERSSDVFHPEPFRESALFPDHEHLSDTTRAPPACFS